MDIVGDGNLLRHQNVSTIVKIKKYSGCMETVTVQEGAQVLTFLLR